MHHIQVRSGVAGAIFAIGSMTIFLIGRPALWYFLAAIGLGAAAATVLRFRPKSLRLKPTAIRSQGTDHPMQCSRNEFLTAIQAWRGFPCAVQLHTDEVRGAFVVTFESATGGGVLKFSAHPLLQPLVVDLSRANKFEFGLPQDEAPEVESELMKRVADEMALARVGGKLVFSMTRLADPFAGRLAYLTPEPKPRAGSRALRPPVEPD
ncbi:MAG: hypothetical protein JO041_06940 [Acidobacteria bacterium]|nr:hypothetical protein [Acidobacteriota bacterium]